MTKSDIKFDLLRTLLRAIANDGILQKKWVRDYKGASDNKVCNIFIDYSVKKEYKRGQELDERNDIHLDTNNDYVRYITNDLFAYIKNLDIEPFLKKNKKGTTLHIRVQRDYDMGFIAGQILRMNI